ncbi:ornithine decarboxylase 2-like isoform X1 [Hyposmocoma kahamanoa]|uniref:ornithine decarboxylase 2-like isoform X1 n=1 Tax=Hyposmocoma kahamanoa TaxID=1477025 RepID=UPI000E6DA111|nr:ornithine decarboxylase 2-like isoform X1 [Hyposmocoma kahamanoa]
METTAQTTFQNDFTHKNDSVHSKNGQFKLRNGTEYKMQYGVEGPKGALVLDGYSAQDVARAMIEKGGQAETFYLLDMDEIYRRIQHLKKMMPRVQIFYAMKANDWDLILKLVVSLGTGFDCASPCEIHKITQLNVNPQSIIFAIPTKTKEWMTFARESGVKHTTFDSSYELKKLKQHWPDAKLLIRIRVDGECTYKLGEKFGCYDTEAIDLLEEAATLGLSVVGVAFHVGSVCTSSDSYEMGLKRAKGLFEHEAKAGRHMKIVDIGGGFQSDCIDRIDEIAKLVNKTLDELFPDSDIQVIAEPGRYVCDSAVTQYNSINNIRRSTSPGENLNMIYINDGFHGTLHYVEPWQTVELYSPKQKQNDNSQQDEKAEEVILWGPTCDSFDRVMKDYKVKLPPCSPTDWLIHHVQGAYTWTFAGPFSSVPIPFARAVISKELWTKLKDCPVFGKSDFVVNPDISAPLSSSLPPLHKTREFNKQLNTPALI